MADSFAVGCYGTAIFLAGRKVTQLLASGTCMASGKVAEYVGRKDLAEPLQQTSANLLVAAKRNFLRDLTCAAGLCIVGYGMSWMSSGQVSSNGFDENESDGDCVDNFIREEMGKIKLDPDGEYRDLVVGYVINGGNATCYDLDGVVKKCGNGLLNGQANCTWADGATYIGDFINGRRHGNGTHTWPDGGRYIGEWKDNMMHGNGTRTWPDGGKRVGEWKDDMMHGNGSQTFADGRRYIGEWESGYLHGKGTISFPRTAGEWDVVYERNQVVSVTPK